jgi:hypothetical protein
MAGYSGTPLLKKLGIKEGHRVLLMNPPRQLAEELRDFAEAKPKPPLDFVLLFATSMAECQADFARAAKLIVPDGMIWIAWPKKTSGIKTDLTENAIRDHALKTKFVDVKVCAIDDTWSGLKLVVRKELRTKT